MATFINHPTEDDLRAALGDLPEGHYLSRDLLAHYLAWAETNGREPVTAKVLGEAIAARLCLPSSKYRGSTRWHLTKRSLECRDWYQETD